MIDISGVEPQGDERWSRLFRGAAQLALTFALLGLGICQGVFASRDFLSQNTLAPLDRNRLLLGILIGSGLAAVIVLGVMLRRRWLGLELLERLGTWVSPLGVLAFLPTLVQPKVWYDKPLPFLVTLAVLCLVLERILRPWFALTETALTRIAEALEPRVPGFLRRYGPVTLVLVGAAGYAGYTFYFSLQQHYRLNTSAYDLGIYDNLMFNALHGHPFVSTVLLGPDGGSYLVGHAEFAMLLFVPLYALRPGPELLLGLQAVMLGFAALPLYLFARTQLTRGAAVVLAFCYLLFAPLHGASFYDFHWLPLAIFFHFWLYFAIATRRNWLVAGCYLILVLIREDVSVGLTCLGLFLVLSGVRVRLGFILMCCSAFAFAFIKFGIMRWAGPFYLAGLIYSLLVAPGEEGFGSVIRTLLTNPMYVVGTLLTEEKLIYALHLFGPLVLLPLRRPRFLALIGGGLFFTLLTTAYSPTVSIRFQYPTHWIPYLFAATVLMVGYLSFGAGGAIRRRSALAALAFGVTVHSYVFGAVLQHDTFVGGFYPVPFHITEAEKRHYADLMTLVDQIPKTASVAATEQEVPHVSTRAAVYTIRAHHGDADYLLINRNGFATNERNVVKQALKRNQYGFVDSRGSFYLFARGQQSPRTDSMLTSLGLPSSKKTN